MNYKLLPSILAPRARLLALAGLFSAIGCFAYGGGSKSNGNSTGNQNSSGGNQSGTNQSSGAPSAGPGALSAGAPTNAWTWTAPSSSKVIEKALDFAFRGRYGDQAAFESYGIIATTQEASLLLRLLLSDSILREPPPFDADISGLDRLERLDRKSAYVLHVLKWTKDNSAVAFDHWYLYDAGWTAHSHSYWGGQEGVLLRNAIAGKSKIYIVYVYLSSNPQEPPNRLVANDPAQVPGTYSYPQTQALPAFVSELSALGSSVGGLPLPTPELGESPDPDPDVVKQKEQIQGKEQEIQEDKRSLDRASIQLQSTDLSEVANRTAAQIDLLNGSMNQLEGSLYQKFSDQFLTTSSRILKRQQTVVAMPKKPPLDALVAYTANTSYFVTYRAANLSITYTNGTPTAPIITSQPMSLGMPLPIEPNPPVGVSQMFQVSENQPITLKIVAEGIGDLQYQWYFASSGGQFSAVPGQTKDTLYLEAARETDEGNYAVVVSNAAGNTTSDTVTVAVANVRAPRSFASTPAPFPSGVIPTSTLTITGGGSVSVGRGFSLSVSRTDGKSIPTDYQYQWFYAAPGSSSYSPLPEATSSTYSQTDARSTDGGYYYVTVSPPPNSFPPLQTTGTVYSNAQPAALTIASPSGTTDMIPVPLLTPPPISGIVPTGTLIVTGAEQKIPVGGKFALTVVRADGKPIPPGFTFQWYNTSAKGTKYAAIDGENGATYSQPSARTTDAGSFVVTVTSPPSDFFPPLAALQSPNGGGGNPSGATATAAATLYTSNQPVTLRVTNAEVTTILPATWPSSVASAPAFPVEPTATASISYTDDEPTWYGFGGMVPLNEIHYMVDGVSAAHQVAYGTIDLYYPKIEPPLMSQRKIPHLVIGIPLSGKAMLHPLFGAAFSLNFFDVVAGWNPDWENQPIDAMHPGGSQPHHHFVSHGIIGIQVTGANISTIISTFKGH
jgi:hypothetical protein